MNSDLLVDFLYACEKWPLRPAFLINGTFYTYGQFHQKIAVIKSTLDARHTIPGSRIGIIVDDNLETYAGIFAILFCGATFVPINPASASSRNQVIIEQAEISLILNATTDAEAAAVSGLPVIDLSMCEGEAAALSLPATAPSDCVYILFTSGSTGVPKGVPISFRNLNSFLDSFFACTCDLKETDRVLQMFELTFDFSVVCYFSSLVKGACVCTVPRHVVRYTYVLELMMEHGVSVVPMVPSLLSYLRPYFSEIQLPNVRHSYFCGEALLSEVVKEWRKCVPNALIQNFYGPTEVTVFSLVYDVPSDDIPVKENAGVTSIGRPMAAVQAIIIDENGIPVRSGQRGELCLAGSQVMNGYWKNPERNQEALVEQDYHGKPALFYRTGDLAYQDDEGDYFFCGRVDFQIQVQGYRVELGEIEYHARKLLPATNLVAIAFSNHIGNSQVHLFYEACGMTGLQLKAELELRLPSYMVPGGFSQVESLPLNSSGKIDRIQLARTAASLQDE